MINFRREKREVPALNTASLPDLIFSVLFFFIIVTHMRQDEVKVKYSVPQGRELAKLAHKASVVHIYIGKPLGGASAADGKYRIQVNDKVVGSSELVDYVSLLRSEMSPEDVQQMTVAISADKDVDMQTVMDVKNALRRANALKITFIGTKKAKTP